MITRVFLSIALALSVAAGAVASSLPATKLWNVLAATAQIERLASPVPSGTLRYFGVRGTAVRGFVNPSLADEGRLRNGQRALIVPLLSGGSAGVTSALLYTTIAARRRFVGYIPSRSGHLQVSFEGGFLSVVTPEYRPNDAQCCPSRQITETYTLRGIRLVRLFSKRVTVSGRPRALER